MSDAIPPDQFPPWRGRYVPHVDDNLALGIGQVEEAMGALDDNDRQGACEALVRARQFLLRAAELAASRVPLAHYAPITDEEAGQ